ncbi:DUF4238 domain-containing protein [Rhodococcus erythropolis]|uniref:DUF4238 domain-containing protein n=1 Tax=Rhodococcus erythropolis TaxID=1833 RepID=UPI00406BD8CB
MHAETMLAGPSNDSLRARIESVAEIAASLTNIPDAPKYHHVVPQSYIRRCTPGRKGSVHPVLVDGGRGKLLGPKKVGGIDDFYRLEADDIDETSTPPLVVEVLLGIFDNLATVLIDELPAAEPGPVTGVEMKSDLAMVVAAQMSRGQLFRQDIVRSPRVRIPTRSDRTLEGRSSYVVFVDRSKPG